MGRKQKKYHYIYKTVCNETNKFYIGMHSTDNMDDGYLGSGKRLWYSLNKYGRSNHSIEILEYCENRKELKKREEEVVNKDLLNEELCMNLRIGGEGGLINEGHHEKMRKGASKWYTEKWKDPSYRDRMIKIVSKSSKKIWANPKYREELLTHLDKVHKGWVGKKHLEESKKKMSNSKKGKGLGKENSQYGSYWVTNGSENKKLKKDIEIPQGWYKGRVKNENKKRNII